MAGMGALTDARQPQADAEESKGKVETVESKGAIDTDMDLKHFEHAANEATELEHNLPFMEVFGIWRKAVIWAILFCVCIIMDGYDSNLITNLYGLPSFQRKYGKALGDGTWYIPAPWQTALAMSSPVGRVVGGAIQGPLAERFGRKKTLIGCLVLVSAFVFIVFFAENEGVLLTGQMLCGVVWGILTSLAPIYASEITPLRLRGNLTAYVSTCLFNLTRQKAETLRLIYVGRLANLFRLACSRA